MPSPARRPRQARATATMADVARESGVSKMTVSRVLAGHGVAAGTRARVLGVIEALGYVPDRSAHALSTGRSGFAAALVPTINNSNFADTARGLTDALKPAGLDLLLGFTEYDDGREAELVRAMLARRPEAIVLTGGHHAAAARTMLAEASIPVVETWDRPRMPLGCSVGFSNADAAETMVRHLHARGYRRIAFLGGEPGGDHRGEQRERGYAAAIRKLRLGPPRILRFGRPPLSMQHGDHAMDQLARTYPDTDAVFCVSDLVAFGAVMACHRRGWDVPGRLAVAGFGDFEVSRICHPRITTIQVDAYALGLRAGEALLAALAARAACRPWPDRRHIAIPVGIAERESA